MSLKPLRFLTFCPSLAKFGGGWQTQPLPWDPSSPTGGRTNQVLIRNWRGGGGLVGGRGGVRVVGGELGGPTQTDQSHRGGEGKPQAEVHIIERCRTYIICSAPKTLLSCFEKAN